MMQDRQLIRSKDRLCHQHPFSSCIPVCHRRYSKLDPCLGQKHKSDAPNWEHRSCFLRSPASFATVWMIERSLQGSVETHGAAHTYVRVELHEPVQFEPPPPLPPPVTKFLTSWFSGVPEWSPLL